MPDGGTRSSRTSSPFDDGREAEIRGLCDRRSKGFDRERPWSARLPWEFVQDDVDARLGVARVLNARNELVCETTPPNADLIVCAVNFLGAQEGPQ